MQIIKIWNQNIETFLRFLFCIIFKFYNILHSKVTFTRRKMFNFQINYIQSFFSFFTIFFLLFSFTSFIARLHKCARIRRDDQMNQKPILYTRIFHKKRKINRLNPKRCNFLLRLKITITFIYDILFRRFVVCILKISEVQG